MVLRAQRLSMLLSSTARTHGLSEQETERPKRSSYTGGNVAYITGRKSVKNLRRKPSFLFFTYFSKQDLWTSGISITYKLIKNTESQVTLQTYWIKISILTRFPEDTHIHKNLRSIPEHLSRCDITGSQCLSSLMVLDGTKFLSEALSHVLSNFLCIIKP